MNVYQRNPNVRDFHENRNQPILQEVRASILKNSWHSLCERCKKDSSAKLNSRNSYEAKHFDQLFNKEKALKITQEDGFVSSPPPLLSIDLRLGNHCNLKCMMCYPGESNKLTKDYALGTGEFEFDDHGQKQEIIVNNESQYLVKNSPYEWIDNQDIFDQLSNLGGQVHKIFLAGGEPFLAKNHLHFLTSLVD
ncbi:MAG: hypothetical protein AAF203_04215, partial [Pseudomonadota bacterium]